MKRLILKKAVTLSLNIIFALSVFSQTDNYIQLAPEVTEDMLCAKYWIAKATDPYKVRMTTDEIYVWNNNVTRTFTFGDNPYKVATELRTFDEVICADLIRGEMQRYPSSVYYKKTKDGSIKLTEKDYKDLYNKMNYKPLGTFEQDFSYQYDSNGKLVEQTKNKTEYKIRKAICVKRSDVMVFPFDEYLSLSETYWWDNENNSSAILANEPLLVLWESADKNWYFIKTSSMCGWTKKENVAFVTDEEFNRYFDYASSEHEPFITITANRYAVPKLTYLDDKTDFIPDLFMGTYLHIKKWSDPNLTAVNFQRTTHGCYAAEIPYRKKDGTLGFRYAEIPYSVCQKGLVPFTQANTLELLFKCIGNPYGWGGQNDFRDCSALAQEVFRCFGFIFGRNSGAQAAMPGKMIDFHGTTDEQVLQMCKDLPAGTLMYFAGHVFMFIGWEKQKLYFLSATGGYLLEKDDKSNVVYANSVIVNNGDLLRRSGKTWLNIITYAKLFDGKLENPNIKLNPKWKFADFAKINSGNAILYKATNNPKNITIAINAGHGTTGGTDFRTFCHPDKSKKIISPSEQIETVAVSKGSNLNSQFSEESLNLRTAHLLKNQLLSNGYNVLMLRDYGDVQLDNIARTVISNNSADIHISLHYDYEKNAGANNVFFCGIPEELKSLENVAAHFDKSQKLGKTLVQALQQKGLTLYNGGEVKNDLTQSSFSTIPTCVIELGNQNTKFDYDSIMLRVEGLVNGINSYFGF